MVILKPEQNMINSDMMALPVKVLVDLITVDLAGALVIYLICFGGGFGSSGRSRRPGPTRGSDIRYNLTISFEKQHLGRQKKLR